MATTTAANVVMIQTGIASLSAESERVGKARARNVARLHGVNAQIRAELELDHELLRKSGAKAQASASELKVWAAKIAAIFEKAEGAEDAFREQLIEKQDRLATRNSELAEAARMLAELGEERSFRDRLGFLAGYMKDVGNEVEKRRAAGKAAADSADGALRLKADEK